MSGFDGLLTGHTLLGRYRIDAVIGRGGFAVVYEAHDERLDRVVAVKVITLAGPEGSMEEEMRARFQREARASAALQHRNVVGIFDFGTDPTLGLDFLVMERLRGEDLRTRLRRPDPIPLADAMHILRSAAAGVGAGHEAGIIHRDVKPANIFLTESRQGEHFAVRVLDFGIALLAAADDTTRLTRHGVPLSVPYASPEQLAGEGEITPASDVFGLGAVAYETLARRRPFSGNPLRAHEERLGALPPLGELNPEVPPHVAAAVHRALSPDPAARFPDAQVFARALESGGVATGRAAMASVPAVIAPAAPAPRPEPERPRPARPSRRKAPLAAGLALLAAAVVGGAVLLTRNDAGSDPPLAVGSADTLETAGEVADSARTAPTVADSAAAPALAAASPTASTPSSPRAAAPRPGAGISTPAPAAPRSGPTAATRPATASTARTPAAPAPTRPAPSAPRAGTSPSRASAPAAAAGAPEFRENLPHACHSRSSAEEAGACLRQDLAEADRELNVVYQRVMSRLPADRRQALRDSQRAWLARYDAVITSYYSTPWGDHSRIRVLPSQIQALRDRTAYLRSIESGGRI